MKQFSAIALAVSLSIGAHSSLGADPLLTVNTESTPITRASEENPGDGEATRFVELLLKQAGIDYQLNYLPWRRAYHNGRKQANVLIYPLARTQKREQDFIWIGALVPIRYYLFQLKDRSDIQLQTLSDARPYQIGVVNYHAHHEMLLDKGFEQLQPVNNSAQNLKKLMLERVDLFAMSDGGIFPLCQRTEIDCQKIKPAVEIDGVVNGLYMALSLDSDPALVKKLRSAFEALKEDGTHGRLFSTRLASLQAFTEKWQ